MLILIVSGLIPMGFGLSNGSSGEIFAGEKQVCARSLSRQSPVPLDSFHLPDIDGRPVDLKTFKGRALLIVNTPSMPVFGKCTSDIVTVDSRWWPFPPMISGSRSPARIRPMGAPVRRTDQSNFKQNCVPTGSPPESLACGISPTVGPSRVGGVRLQLMASTVDNRGQCTSGQYLATDRRLSLA